MTDRIEYKIVQGPVLELEAKLNELGADGFRIIHFHIHGEGRVYRGDAYATAVLDKITWGDSE